ncbi:MAG: alpha/beta fold hydrolase [bacterium]|nr:alpha/beta fold hydrolase [bacterium]
MPDERVAAAVASLYAAHRLLDPSAERVEIPFEGAPLVGNLRRPPGASRPPLVLLIPGLDSTKEEFFHWEAVFLSRGMATFSLDGPGQGESGYTTCIRHDYEVAVTAALDTLAGRGGFDPSRVGAAGVSLGGYYAPRAAAYHPMRLPPDIEVGLDAAATFRLVDPVFPFGVYAAVVEIDRTTGQVHVLRLVAVDDAGTIVNPLLAEQVIYDAEGQLLTVTFADYPMLRAHQVVDVTTEFLETPSPFNPLGIRHVEMPLVPEKMWHLVRGA